MERFLNTGPFAEKLNADQKKALLVFAEANKKLKKSEFRPKFQAEFVPTMPVDIQVCMSAINFSRIGDLAGIAERRRPQEADGGVQGQGGWPQRCGKGRLREIPRNYS